VLHDHKGAARGFWDVLEELLERLQATGGGPDRDDDRQRL
jgi:hypothetical protein